MVCTGALGMRQTCRAGENCCATISFITTCGCAIPLLGCIPRGGPGC
jgi:hypothetical protein